MLDDGVRVLRGALLVLAEMPSQRAIGMSSNLKRPRHQSPIVGSDIQSPSPPSPDFAAAVHVPSVAPFALPQSLLHPSTEAPASAPQESNNVITSLVTADSTTHAANTTPAPSTTLVQEHETLNTKELRVLFTEVSHNPSKESVPVDTAGVQPPVSIDFHTHKEKHAPSLPQTHTQLEMQFKENEERAASSLNVPSSALSSPSAEPADNQEDSAHTSLRRVPRERSVPSSPISRVLHFGGLAAGLAFGTLSEMARRSLAPSPSSGSSGSAESKDGNSSPAKVYSSVLTEANAERLAEALCRMRGAALKLGQMLSIQDETTIPPQVQAVLERVRQSADVMPQRQLDKVMTQQIGAGWRDSFSYFSPIPIAAASIGQVHRGVLKEASVVPGWDIAPGEVAIKIQYPGVAESIDSDLDNLNRLVKMTGALPEGLFVNEAVVEIRAELKDECDYRLEAGHQRRFGELVRDDSGASHLFRVPHVIDHLSSERVLTTEMVRGVSIAGVATMSQDVRNLVALSMLRLTLKQLFQWRFMQTDPNWGNFLYDPQSGIIKLIDFGATREYSKPFVDTYLEVVQASAERDRNALIDASIRAGFLTGDESKEMLDAHCESGFIVGEPFAEKNAYDFKGSKMTERIQALGAVMLKHRLKAPPKEAYSLHRMLSGAFLLCIKLNAVIPCREDFLSVLKKYSFGPELDANAGKRGRLLPEQNSTLLRTAVDTPVQSSMQFL